MNRLQQLLRTLESPQCRFEALVSLAETLDASDFDLSRRMRELDPQAPWSSVSIYRDVDSEVSLFMVPGGRIMPLHDHPDMHVIFKPLWGQLRIRAFDWAREHPFSGLARQTYDKVVDGGSEALVVGPQRGNLHTLVAREAAAFVDILIPGYDPQAGRVCRYYREVEPVPVGDELLIRLELSD